MTTDPRALDGVFLDNTTHTNVGIVLLTFRVPEGAEAKAAEHLRGMVSGALHLARNPFVTTRMEQPPTDANGMPVELER